MNIKAVHTLLILAVFFSSLLGCDADELSEYQFQDFSYLSAPSRASVRTAHRLFIDHPSSPYNVLAAFEIIEQEALRLYLYDELTRDFSFENLVLVLPDTLPETDSWGDYTEDGGYILWTENTIVDGVTKTVSKRNREFTTGLIGDFDYGKSNFSIDTFSSVQHDRHRMQVAEDITYIETLWHQAYGGSFQDTASATGTPIATDYSYQSHPNVRLVYFADSSREQYRMLREEIKSQSGWETQDTSWLDYDVTGTLTLYKPVMTGLDKNIDGESSVSLDDVENNFRTVRSVETKVSKETNNIGAAGAIEEIKTTTKTVDETRKSDAVTGATIQFDRRTHETVDVRYRIAYAQGPNDVPYREFEWRSDYHDTTVTVLQENYSFESNSPSLRSCENDDDCPESYECRRGFAGTRRCLARENLSVCNPNQISYGLSVDDEEVCLSPTSMAGTNEVWRGTTNQLTRNSIDQWKSTKEVYTVNYDTEQPGLVQTFQTTGPRWLIDRIEVDPDYDAVPFAVKGKWSEDMHSRNILVGDDLSGLFTETTTRRSDSYELGWANVSTEISGAYSIQDSSLGATGGGYSVSANDQGEYTVAIGEARVDMASDEWLRGVILDYILPSK